MTKTKKVLVTYATCTGSTVGVAEAIARRLGEAGLSVDVLPMKDAVNLSGYDAVVAGSAVHGNQWLPEAVQFVETNRAVLSAKPFAAFLVCMTLAIKNGEYAEHVKEYLAPIRALVPTISEGCFTGILDIKKVPTAHQRWKFRLSVLFGVWKTGDHRDWAAINAWGDELAKLLK